jgi:Asp-tRNA(Asn)/Glu-tRNA(Gln) amidotransferase A subunit family amidase
LDDGGLSPERFLAEADRHAQTADERYRACVELRPGNPGGGPIRVGVKDVVDVAGFATRLGRPGYRHYPVRTAAVLRRVPAEAVVAKLVTPELGLGLEHGCVNPRFPHLNPSGSSTGSAVAVAAGICDLAMGTDSSASIRLPANACGVTGLRLTHDHGNLDGLLPLAPLLDAPGWLARTPDDLAFAWDRFGLGLPVGGPGRRYRFGVPAGLGADGCLPEILDVLDGLAHRLAGSRHTVSTLDIGDLLDWRPAVWELVARDSRDEHHRLGLDREITESVRACYAFGATVDDRRREQIVAALTGCRADITARFARDAVDAWLTPTTARFPRPAGEAGGSSTVPDFSDPAVRAGLGYATLASFAGLPALSVPVTVVAHAPVSFQLVGPPRSEPTLIDAARTVLAEGGPQ